MIAPVRRGRQRRTPAAWEMAGGEAGAGLFETPRADDLWGPPAAARPWRADVGTLRSFQ